MHLRIRFDEKILLSETEKDSRPMFFIYWEFGNSKYPDDDWLDAGTIILSWWLMALVNLVNGSTHEELVFMEGPFLLKLVSDSQPGYLLVDGEKTPFACKVRFIELCNEIVSSAEAVVDKLNNLGIAQSAQETLMIGISRLRNFGL